MKKIPSLPIILFILGFAFCSSTIFGRTFKTLAGVPIEGSLVKVKSSGTQKIAVIKLDRTGRDYEIAVTRLSKMDQIFVFGSNKMEGKPSANSVLPSKLSGGSAPPSPSSNKFAFANMMTKLVAVKGRKVASYKIDGEPDYYAFYFAASWCPACTQFTPDLVKYYKNNISYANPKFDIIFVSRDASKQAMDNYMLKNNMPWPAISYSNSFREKLIKQYAPSGTPSLVLVDRAGKVISESFVDGKPRGAFAVKQDIAFWFTDGERIGDNIIRSSLTNDKRVSD